MTAAAAPGPDGVVVVGTGLGALGAILGLLSAGIRPTIIDVGVQLEADLQSMRARMAASLPGDWSPTDVARLSRNDSAGRAGVPRKLAFGSGYLYADDPSAPPHSFARGGFSVAWGGAFLPPRDEDLTEWPLRAGELLPHARAVLDELPVSEPVDGLSALFPTLRSQPSPPLRPTPGERELIRRLEVAVRRAPSGTAVAGQSRLMTAASAGGGAGDRACRSCGFCMSGCVYGAILDSGAEIERLAASGLVDLRSGLRVTHLWEGSDHVRIHAVRSTDRREVLLTADRVFLAAGAIESTRIVLRSFAPAVKEFTVLRTGGGLLPLVTRRRLENAWPDMNTQASAFLELVAPEVSDHWIHVQMSAANELLLAKLGLLGHRSDPRRKRLRWGLAERIVVAIMNLHSDHGPRYRVRVNRDGAIETIATESFQTDDARRSAARARRHVRAILREAGLYSIRPLEQDAATGIGYHLGGSLPMRADPSRRWETDALGRPIGTRAVHVVDASVLPSIPGTTIGLPIMANARRIAATVASAGR